MCYATQARELQSLDVFCLLKVQEQLLLIYSDN